MSRLLLILLLTFPFTAFSQPQYGIIKGTVTSNGRPVPGANVAIVELQKGAATDVEGVFKITRIHPGTYTLAVSAVGYAEKRRKIALSPSSGIRTVDIVLKQKTEELGELVVTGTMRKTYVKESPVKVTVINSRRLEQGKTSSNIMDLIDGINGLSTQLNCGVCGTNAIRINGVEGPNTAVLIDGMPIMGALASVYGLNGISPSIIDQVEVIKGPQSTLYGTQALGGVVNIITKNPDLTPTFSADIYAKSTEEMNVDMAVSPKLGRFKGFVSGNLTRMENFFDRNGDGFNDVAKRSRASLFVKGTLRGEGGEERLNLAAKIYGEDRTGGVASYTDELRGSNSVYGESIYTQRAELMADYQPAGLNERLRISGAVTYHDQDSFYGSEHYDARQGIVFGQAVWRQPLGKDVHLLAGTTLRYESYDDNTPATSEGVDRRFIPGVFAQSEFSTGSFTLLAGLRVDHHTEHGPVTAPRLSAKYSPSDRTTIRASTGTGFRVVNVFTEDHAALTGSRQVVFAEGLDPERSQSVTASVEHIFTGANPLTLSLDGFYTHFSNKIIPDYDRDPRLIVYENLNGFSVTRGFSAGVEHNLTVLPLSYTMSLTVMDVFTEEGSKRRALAYAPDYTGAFGATYNMQGLGLSVGYAGSLVGPKRMPDSYVEQFGRERWSPAHTVHNLKLTKEFADVNSERGVGVKVYISLENMFDYTQGSPLVGASEPFGPEFDTIYTWGPLVGRTFLVGARLNLR